MQGIKSNALEEAKKEIGDHIRLLNSTTACFTGHRSRRLPWRYNEEAKRCKVMKEALRAEIEKAIQRGYKTFLCGMSPGFDMICAEIVIDLKKKYKDIKLKGAVSCGIKEIRWSARNRKRYGKLLSMPDEIHCTHDEHIEAEGMLERNRYMVNNSSLMLALFSGLPGRTQSTIDYARKQGLEIVVIKP